MAYKSIVTFTRSVRTDQAMLESAAALAQAGQGHLSVICLGVDRIQPGAYYAGANVIALQQSLQEAQAEADSAEGEARSLLSAHAVSWDITALPVQIGTLGHLVATRAQFADLIVLPKPYGAGRGQEDVAILESALFGTRVPVLVIPERNERPTETKRIVICWNQSVEALASIRAALPFLKRAEEVDICVVDPPPHGADRSDPGGLVAEMLSRHGIRADISVLAKTLPRVSDVICRHCTDVNADMIVMGAYGHSRLREAILGGATRNMLEMSEFPILMAH